MTTTDRLALPRGELGTQRVPYYVGIIGASLAFCTLASADLAPTALAVVASWGIFTAVIRPNGALAARGFFVALTVALLLRNYAELDTVARLWGGLDLLILATPFFIRPLRNERAFPFLHLWCLIEGIYIYLSFLFAKPPLAYEQRFTSDIRVAGYQTMALFLAVLVGTGLVVQAVLSRRSRGLVGAAPDDQHVPLSAIRRAYLLIAGGIGVSGLVTISGIDASLGSLAAAIELIGFGGWLILVMLWMDGRLPARHKAAVILLPIAWAFVNLGGGLLYPIAYPGFFVLGLWMGRRHAVPWAPILLALIVLIALNTQKNAFRLDVRSGKVTGSTAELTQDWLARTGENLDTTTTENLTNASYRFANSDLLGYVVTYVPERYPHFGYEAYTTLPEVLIPRVILPSKGSYNLANDFGREYELIGRSDTITSVNTPLHVEAYAAGGPSTLVIVGAIVGAYLALLGRIFRAGSAVGSLTGALLSLQIVLSIESGTLALILTLPFALFLGLIMWWATRDPDPPDQHGSLDPTIASVLRARSARADEG